MPSATTATDAVDAVGSPRALAASPGPPPRTAAAAAATPRALLPRWWPFFVAIWLVFVVTQPVPAMLAPSLTAGRMLVVLAWTIAFLTIYLWLMLHRPFAGERAAPAERRRQAALLLLLTALVLAVDLAFPPGFFWLFIYVVLPAGIVLPTRAAIWTTIAVTALATGADVARGQGTAAGYALGIVPWGVGMIMLRRLVVTVDELRAAREELARLAVAEERLRFARDLHDLLGHSLSLIALKSELAGRLATGDATRAAAEIADVEQVARRALREVREAVAGYRRPTLAEELAGVRELLAAAGIETRVESDAAPLPPEVDAVLAWAVREGATNVIRHSGARHCTITVAREDGTARAEVVDDGRGAVGGDRATGSGLAGLAERTAALGGRLAAGGGEQGGFHLRIDAPIAAAPTTGAGKAPLPVAPGGVGTALP